MKAISQAKRLILTTIFLVVLAACSNPDTNEPVPASTAQNKVEPMTITPSPVLVSPTTTPVPLTPTPTSPPSVDLGGGATLVGDQIHKDGVVYATTVTDYGLVAIDDNGNAVGFVPNEGDYETLANGALTVDDRVWLWNTGTQKFEQPEYLKNVDSKRVIVDEHSLVTIKDEKGMPRQVYSIASGDEIMLEYDRVAFDGKNFQWKKDGRGVWDEIIVVSYPSVSVFREDLWMQKNITNPSGALRESEDIAGASVFIEGQLVGYQFEDDSLIAYVAARGKVGAFKVDVVEEKGPHNSMTDIFYPVASNNLNQEQVDRLKFLLDKALTLSWDSGEVVQLRVVALGDVVVCNRFKLFNVIRQACEGEIQGSMSSGKLFSIVNALTVGVFDGNTTWEKLNINAEDTGEFTIELHLPQ